jgi:cobalt/nickel transport system permease protein
MHASDARLKFLLTLAFILAVALLPIGAYVALFMAWLSIVAAAWSAHLGPWRTVRAAFLALPFMLAALPIVFTRGAPNLAELEVGPITLPVSEEGLRQFTTIALKSWISVQAALLLSFTTPFHDLIDGLRELRLPRVFVGIVSFMYRYLGVLGDEAHRMNRARISRSADRGGRGTGSSLAWRARVTGSMVGSLFLRSYERSERIYAAMQARGFDGELRYLPGPSIAPRALVLFAFTVTAIAAFELAAHLWGPRW